MQNITVQLYREDIRRIKAMAAREFTTVSALALRQIERAFARLIGAAQKTMKAAT